MLHDSGSNSVKKDDFWTNHIYKDNIEKVKCNWCGAHFDETEIEVNVLSDEERCPYCHVIGFMIWDEEEENADH